MTFPKELKYSRTHEWVRLQEDGTVIFRFLPCRQENHRTTLYTEGEERERILALEESLSQGITLDQDGVVKR